MTNLTHIRSQKKKDFIEHFVENGNALEACRYAGYKSDDYKKLRNLANTLKSQLKKEIEEKSRERLKHIAPKALHTMEHLMTNADTDAVRFQASKDLLDRAGYKPEETQLEVKRSIEEMEAQLISLVGDEGAKILLQKVVVRRTVPTLEEPTVIN